MNTKEKIEKRAARHKRLRSVVKGLPEKPRLSVFRSNNHIYAQLIDDTKSITLMSANDLKEVKDKKSAEKDKKSIAFKIGEALAKKALEKGIKEIVFDRGGYKYHGRVKALAEGARQGGLKF